MCQQLKHVYTCACKPSDDDDATFFRFCARVAKASDLERVKCLAKAMRAVKKGKAQVEEVKTKCRKCKKIKIEEKKLKNHRIESRHYYALRQYERTRLANYAAKLYADDKSLPIADQQVLVKDESRLLEFRLYNLTKKYWPQVPPKQLEKYAAPPPPPPTVGEAKMPEIQNELPMVRKSVARASMKRTSTSAIANSQASKATSLSGIGKKRKADAQVDGEKSTKVAKVEDADVKTAAKFEEGKKGWCVVM